MNNSLSKLFSLMIILTLMISVMPIQNAQAVSPDIVISQVYGGGGNSGATYTHDFIELFNRGTTEVNITGWSVQYASSAGTTWLVTALSGIVQPGQYYLVQEAQGAGGTTSLPTPDASGSISMSATSAKVAVVNTATALSGDPPADANIVDVLGYGSATFFEGSGAAPTLSNTSAAFRGNGGCTDTDNNASDFSSGAPNPRNTASPLHPCSEPTSPSGIGTASPNTVAAGESTLLTVTVTPATNPISTGLAVTADLSSIGGNFSQIFYDDGTNGDVTAADNVFSYFATVAVSATSGILSLPATITDAQNRAGSAFISLTVRSVVPIHDVQGSGSAVAITTPVILEGIVVGDFQGNDQLSGFFLQEEDSDADGDSNTSEGIFVFCGSCTTDVAVGDLVQVDGLPEEFSGMSQIDITLNGSVKVLSSDNPLPSPATIDFPAAGSTKDELTFENLEGMLVTFSDTLYLSESFGIERFGHILLSTDSHPLQFTAMNDPSVPDYAAYLAELNSNQILLDDDNNFQNNALGNTSADDKPYFWPRPGLSNSNLLRGGDSISGLTGVLHWSFAGSSGTDAWRVRPVEPAFSYEFTTENSRTLATTPAAVGGTLKVASFNVLNYFTSIGDRGADSATELTRQREKIAEAICAINADIVGLIEIENNGDTALNDLLSGTNGINSKCNEYSPINTGTITGMSSTDAIKVGIIYKPSTVSPVGSFAVLDRSIDTRFDDTRNRPVLAQTFEESTTGEKLTVALNHFKSKGSSCIDVGDPDANDGQGNCNGVRTSAAEALVDWLATDPTSSGDSDILILGDLNSYALEDPITAIKAEGYEDLINEFIGDNAYSFVFDGQWGYLDHALATTSLANQVTGVTQWHINADEVSLFDYDDDILDSSESSFERESTSLPIYEPNPFRSSDHDPVIIGFSLGSSCETIPPTLEVSVTPDTLLIPNHKYVEVSATVIVGDDTDPTPAVALVSVASNEPDNGVNDGNTVNDIVILDDHNFLLRAERSGRGSGRVYTITYMAIDVCGNVTTQSATVTVPVNQRK